MNQNKPIRDNEQIPTLFCLNTQMHIKKKKAITKIKKIVKKSVHNDEMYN